MHFFSKPIALFLSKFFSSFYNRFYNCFHDYELLITTLAARTNYKLAYSYFKGYK